MKETQYSRRSVLAAGGAAMLAACGGAGSSAPKTETVTLRVYAAASLTETLTEIGARYMTANKSVTVQFSFDSSGTLLRQIREAGEGDADLFISAAPKQMDALEEAGVDLLVPGSRVDLLENKVVLCVPDAGAPGAVKSFEELAQRLQGAEPFVLAMGNSDVPVGQYTEKILTWFGLEEEVLAKAGHLSYGSNVKEVVAQVKEGSVDGGVVYATDACSAGLTAVAEAAAEMCGRVVYPAAVLKLSRHPEAAQAFLDSLRTKEAAAVFESVGFTVL